MGDLGMSKKFGKQASRYVRCKNCRREIEEAPMKEHRKHCERAKRRKAKAERKAAA